MVLLGPRTHRAGADDVGERVAIGAHDPARLSSTGIRRRWLGAEPPDFGAVGHLESAEVPLREAFNVYRIAEVWEIDQWRVYGIG